MEAFNVFATLSLVDLMSGPLGAAQASMLNLEGASASLGTRLGNLTLAMAPVATAAGVILGVLGLAAKRAMIFESAMADVAKVINFESPEELKAFSNELKAMSGEIPMVVEGLADIMAAAGQSGVVKKDLQEFTTQAAKMGVAFDLSGAEAGKMMADWRAGMNLSLPQTYALADAVNYLSNNMNATAPALGEVMQRVGAVTMACGLAENQVAALGASFLSAGASPEVASTALRKFTSTLVKGVAMSKTQANAFQGLGFSVTQMAKDMQTNAQGTIFKVLEAIAAKPKELQMSLLTEMFGEESIGAIAPLLKNMGLLSQSFELVGDNSKYAGSMQGEFEARSKTTANALQLMYNKLSNLAISVGNLFLPAIAKAANFVGNLADALRQIVDSSFGQWLLKLIGGVATAILAFTALSASLWAFTAIIPVIKGAMAPLLTALLALGAPIWLLIAAIGALYTAYHNNFGGMADTLSRWGNNLKLVVRGVIAIFQSLKGNVFEIKGELAKDLKAAGLEGLVVKISKVVYRIKQFFTGLAEGIGQGVGKIQDFLAPLEGIVASALQGLEAFATGFSFDWLVKASEDFQGLGKALGGVFSKALELVVDLLEGFVRLCKSLGKTVTQGFAPVTIIFNRLSERLQGLAAPFAKMTTALGAAFSSIVNFIDPILSKLFGSEISTGTGTWEKLGSILGSLVLVAIKSLGTALELIVLGISNACSAVTMLVSLFRGDFSGALEAAKAILNNLGSAFLALGDLFGIAEIMKTTWDGILAWFNGLSLYDSGVKLLSTLAEGIKSMAAAPFNAAKDALQSVRNLLPFSDAKEGPLSTLTLSGQRLMTTLASGVGVGEKSLVQAVNGALGEVTKTIDITKPSLNLGALGGLEGGKSFSAAMSSLALPKISLPNLDNLTNLDSLTGLTSLASPNLPPISLPSIPEPPLFAKAATDTKNMAKGSSQGKNTTINISSINLPSVKDAKDFLASLQNLVAEYEGDLA